MKKLFLNKDEDIASIAEKVITDAEKELVLVVPKGAAWTKNAGNFALLRREATGAGKTILIETVDSDAIALATKAKIGAVHPLLSENRSRSLSDIVSHGEPVAAPAEEARKKEENNGIWRAVSRKIAVTREPKEESAEAIVPTVAEPVRPEPAKPFPEEVPEQEPLLEAPPFWRRRMRAIVALVAVLLLVGAGVWVLNTYYSSVRVTLAFKTTPWQWNGNFSAEQAAAKTSADGARIPAEVLREKKTTTQFFPASGKASVSQKAAGRITVYNAYSSVAQPLVATTRFVTPDGRVFRLDQGITVPGAEVKDGKIIPSSIEANVTADKPGEEYNLGPVEKLAIPGFKGTPKYEAFYGALPGKTSGGFVGERAVPTAADIEAAKGKTEEVLRSVLQGGLLTGRPADLKIVDGASEIVIGRMAANTSTDEKGNFSIVGEAEFRAVAFREGDVRSVLLAFVQKDHPNLVFKDAGLTYYDAKPDFGAGTLAFSLDVKGILWPPLDPKEFRDSLLGKSVADARKKMLSLPDLEQANISLWPRWLGTFPAKAEKVNIEVK